jgi:hypothetical protein
MLAVAAGHLSEEAFTQWVRQHAILTLEA